jgi:hypothetical protein
MMVTRLVGSVSLMTGRRDHRGASLMIGRGGYCDSHHRTVQAHKAEHHGQNDSTQCFAKPERSHCADIVPATPVTSRVEEIFGTLFSRGC